MKLQHENEFVVKVEALDPDAVVWFNGALDWQDIHLSEGLRADLGRYAADARRVDLGERAAERLAGEIGAPFVVDLIDAEGRRRGRFASDAVGVHEPAVRAFTRMLEQERRATADAAAFRRRHPDADWYIGS